MAELIRLGCTYIQIDSPQYTALLDPDLREGYRQRGNDPDRLLDLSIEMDNAVIGDHPGIIFGLHLCRGNNQSKFYAAGDYGPITKVFRNTKFQRFLLEYDDDRSGGFEPLRQVPADRTVVLGLVSSKKPDLESKDELKKRIEAASAFIALERLALSPQCGFASTMEGNAVTVADQEAKLRLVTETAQEVWGKSVPLARTGVDSEAFHRGFAPDWVWAVGRFSCDDSLNTEFRGVEFAMGVKSNVRSLECWRSMKPRKLSALLVCPVASHQCGSICDSPSHDQLCLAEWDRDR